MGREQREHEHQRPERLERLLQEFEQLLGPLEQQQIARLSGCNEPILLIMGCARSGSTLIYQYLSYSGVFTYPTNFVSRFYYAPYIGARLQQMLFDCDFRQEIFEDSSTNRFESSLGKTRGPKAPHEFWYFWRRFFDFPAEHRLDESQLESVDGGQFLQELSAFQSVESKPLLMKGMIMNWNIPFLASLDRRIHFLFVRRDLEQNSRSLAGARKAFFGDENAWYSFKPPGFREVIGCAPHVQTEWQVRETNRAVSEGLATVGEDRVMEISYEEFCARPRRFLQTIADKFGVKIPSCAASLPVSFSLNRSEGTK